MVSIHHPLGSNWHPPLKGAGIEDLYQSFPPPKLPPSTGCGLFTLQELSVAEAEDLDDCATWPHHEAVVSNIFYFDFQVNDCFWFP